MEKKNIFCMFENSPTRKDILSSFVLKYVRSLISYLDAFSSSLAST